MNEKVKEDIKENMSEVNESYNDIEMTMILTTKSNYLMIQSMFNLEIHVARFHRGQ